MTVSISKQLVQEIRKLSPKKPILIQANFWDDLTGYFGQIEILHKVPNPAWRKYKPLRELSILHHIPHGQSKHELLRALRSKFKRWRRIK